MTPLGSCWPPVLAAAPVAAGVCVVDTPFALPDEKLDVVRSVEVAQAATSSVAAIGTMRNMGFMEFSLRDGFRP
jgi:hypothetical protein